MSLDITAYKNLCLEPSVSPNQAKDEPKKYFNPGTRMEYSERIWPGRGDGLIAKAVYTFTDKVDVPIGSCGRYNDWRRQLLKFADFLEGQPFLELLDFADNEGVIGPVVSSKLLVDFTNHADSAKMFFEKFGRTGDDWLTKYMQWQKVFYFAAENGAVSFH